tara:strand:- start:35 stop:259 length:225 start_codon:yes stop_codon:yes gene_type:complete
MARQRKISIKEHHAGNYGTVPEFDQELSEQLIGLTLPPNGGLKLVFGNRAARSTSMLPSLPGIIVFDACPGGNY